MKKQTYTHNHEDLVKIGDKIKIVFNLSDHTGYKEGTPLTITSITDDDYIQVSEGGWYIDFQECVKIK